MVIVSIEEGKLKGKIGEDIRGNAFYSFQGIPYAAPPTGNFRFKAPRPVEPWTGIKEATEEGDESLSKHLFTRQVVGSEDCLNLNVYTPDLPSPDHPKPLKPVMFWIHGGIFSTGSSRTELFGPEFLMPEDIVLVSINYRLGVLGFLSLHDASLGVPGNAAFKDMVMALKWVQRNIAHFCGDPNNVTLFGESSGGAAAHLLMLSPMAAGLFHKVIAQSGSGLNQWVPGRRSAELIAAELGFHNSDDRYILPFLQSVPAKDILRVQTKLESEDYGETQHRLFGLVLERPSDEEPFLTEHPFDIIHSGKYHHVPLILGYNEEEGMAFDLLTPPRAREHFYNNQEIIIPFTLNLHRGSKSSLDAAERIRRFYFGDAQPNREDNLVEYYRMFTDACFVRDVYFSTKLHAVTSTKPIYFYRLSLLSDLNIFKTLSGVEVPGVFHGDDLGYLFKTSFTPEITPDSIEDIAQRRFTRMWANFARCGVPTPEKDDPLLTTTWTPLTKDKFNYLDIGEELIMKVDPEPERLGFWQDLYRLNSAVSIVSKL